MGGEDLQKQIKDKQILQNKNLIKYRADEQLIAMTISPFFYNSK